MADEEQIFTEIAPSSKSLVQVKIGSREYSMVRSIRCGVCMHPGRFAIEEKLLLNFSYPGIVRFISDQEVRGDDGEVVTWPALTPMQLRHHREAGHLGLDAEAVSELAARRAEQLGWDVEKATGQLVDHHIAAKMVVQQGMQKLLRGEMDIQAKDLMAATKFFEELESGSRQDADLEQYKELILLFWKTTQQVVGPDKFREIMLALRDNPIVQDFQKKQKSIEGKK